MQLLTESAVVCRVRQGLGAGLTNGSAACEAALSFFCHLSCLVLDNIFGQHNLRVCLCKCKVEAGSYINSFKNFLPSLLLLEVMIYNMNSVSHYSKIFPQKNTICNQYRDSTISD